MIDLILPFWEMIVAGALGLVALFYKHRGDKLKHQAEKADWMADAHKEMRDHEREAMQMDDVTLASRISRKP